MITREHLKEGKFSSILEYSKTLKELVGFFIDDVDRENISEAKREQKLINELLEDMMNTYFD